jgi:hypothetical protein
MQAHIGLLVWSWILIAPALGILFLSNVGGGDNRY